jgi:hypothetical protein
MRFGYGSTIQSSQKPKEARMSKSKMKITISKELSITNLFFKDNHPSILPSAFNIWVMYRSSFVEKDNF